MDRFNGVATKYLQHYLAWFRYIDSKGYENTFDGIKFVMEYQPKPNKFHLEQSNENKQSEVALNDNGFNAPVQEGIYYYSYGTWWMDEKEANVSRGSAFYTFAIKVN